MTFLALFYEFFKIGLFSIGGGLAALPFLQELTAKYTWFTPSQLTDMIAISESTPGPIGINCATFAGFSAAGIPGAVVATFSIVLPSIILVFIISGFLQRYYKNRTVQNVFSSLRPAALGLIAAAGWWVVSEAVFKFSGGVGLAAVDLKALALFAVLLILSNIRKLRDLHPLFYLGASAVIGIIGKF